MEFIRQNRLIFWPVSVMLIFVLVIAVIISWKAVSYYSYSTKDAQVHEIPDFNLKDINGKVFSSDSLKDQPAILLFWTTWCGACKPVLDYLDKSDKANNYRIITFSVKEKATTVKDFVATHAITLPVLLLNNTDLFSVNAYPTVYVTDGKGNYTGPVKNKTQAESFFREIEALTTGQDYQAFEDIDLKEISIYIYRLITYYGFNHMLLAGMFTLIFLLKSKIPGLQFLCYTMAIHLGITGLWGITEIINTNTFPLLTKISIPLYELKSLSVLWNSLYFIGVIIFYRLNFHKTSD